MRGTSIRLAVVFAIAIGGVARAQEPAVAAATQAARAAPTSVEAARHLAVVLLHAGRFDEATRAFHRVSQLRHGDPQALYEEASVGFAKNDFRAARNACRALEGRYRETLYAHVCLARSFLTLNRSERAFEQLALAQAIDPNNYELQLAIGESHRLRMDFAESESAYREAIRIAPSEAAPHLGLGRLYAAANRRADALAQFRAASALDADWPEVQFELGVAVGGAEGLALLRASTTGSPNVAPSQLALGEAEFAAGNHEAARVAYDRAVTLDDQLAPAQVGLGRALVRLGRDREAEERLTLALTLLPNSTAAFLALAEVHARTDRFEEAYEDYRRAADGTPGDPTPLLEGARLAMAHGRDTLAQAFLDRLLAINVGHGDAYALRGDVMMNVRDYAAAVSSYEQALATTNLTDRTRTQTQLAEARRRAATRR